MSIGITEKDMELLMAMAMFQMKVMCHIPREVIEKATAEAIMSGDISVSDVPAPEDIEEMCNKLNIPSSRRLMN